jgi:HSP20 family molecular chaperone IbpA
MATANKESRWLATRVWLPGVLLCALLPATGWSQEFAPYPGDWNAPRYPGPVRGHQFAGALRVQTTMTRDGYYARIHVRGIRPEDIRVYPRHGNLVIETDEGGRNGTLRPGARGASQWQLHLRRQLRLPYDADVSGMTRNTENGSIDIFLPFR